jgi:hypothetical protein
MKTLKSYSNLLSIIGLTFLFLVFTAYLFPHFDIKKVDGGLESLDIRSSYSPADVYTLFQALGLSGIVYYKKVLLLDMLFPLIYGLWFILVLRYLQKNMGRLGKLTAWMAWFPAVVVLLDYTENINTWLMLSSFPKIQHTAIIFGSTVTGLKWYGISICAGLVVCALLAVILRNTLWKWRNKYQPQK